MSRDMFGRLRYRGWTLVDLRNARYAAKGVSEYVRVCGLHDPDDEALRRFRRVVDEIEDGRSQA